MSKIRILKFLILSYFFIFSILSFEIVSSAESNFTYDAKGKRNPFIPLVTSDGRILKLDSDENAKNLIINGIIFDKTSLSYAIVNDQIVRVGDIIGEYQVLKIEENKVIFIKEGELLEVSIEKEEP